MLLAVSLALAGCGGAPKPPATPLPAVPEYKYNELPAECFPGYRNLVEEFARSMVNQIDQLNEGHVISNIDSRPIRNNIPPGKEADRSICSARFAHPTFRLLGTRDDAPSGSSSKSTGTTGRRWEPPINRFRASTV